MHHRDGETGRSKMKMLSCYSSPRLTVSVVILAFLSFLAVAGVPGRGIGAGLNTTVEIPAPPVPGARMPAVPLPGRLVLPDGGGRAPVVILLHGCGGAGRGRFQLEEWTRRLPSGGYGALIVDSLTPRAVDTVCPPEDQPKVTLSL